MTLEILQRFCAAPDSGRDPLLSPFGVEWNGRVWGGAADGQRLLLLADVAVDREAPRKTSDILTPFAGAAGVPVDLAALALFCGAPAQPPASCVACTNGVVPCDECDGDGQVGCSCYDCGHEHTRVCPECHGRGRVACASCRGWRVRGRPSRRVQIGDAYFDAALVAASLVDAERTTGTAQWIARGLDESHALVGNGWLLIVMPLRSDAVDPGAEMSRFLLRPDA